MDFGPPTVCICDPTWDPVTTFPDGCFQIPCFAYSEFTVVVFSVVIIYTLLLLAASIKLYPQWEVKKGILVLILIGCTMRVARFAMILNTDLVRPRKSSIMVILYLLYTLPYCIGFFAYSLLVYLWIKFYPQVIVPMRKDELPTFDSKDRFIWLPTYVTLVTLIEVIWAASLLYDIYSQSKTSTFNICLFIFTLLFVILLGIYARRMTIVFTNLMVPGVRETEQFQRMRIFSIVATVVFVVSMTMVLLTSIINLWVTSVTYFVVRHWIYRSLDLAVLFALLYPFHKGFFSIVGILFFGSTPEKSIFQMSGQSREQSSPSLIGTEKSATDV